MSAVPVPELSIVLQPVPEPTMSMPEQDDDPERGEMVRGYSAECWRHLQITERGLDLEDHLRNARNTSKYHQHLQIVL